VTNETHYLSDYGSRRHAGDDGLGGPRWRFGVRCGPPTQGNPSCFGAYARAEQGQPGPGEGVSELASSGAALVAEELVPLIQDVRPEVGAPPPPPSLP
jgi:hypothetical protein